ncbi:PREDICTED: uncharacterized protein LOC104597053 [Nelumbo nucifera]|uniref:Uncharacterized protein LOC104597053 n=2 Tax=Nelumbo nucifera TaxID=4432 RepID=A0A1U7ZR63_NELNU|nr:PREDICTED: uncharacterized protein LOC104597053 [Nelumbo nucifera]DAD26583.1 TPA_asm: hypothetical protein HUJ06_028051 [Nelumbo nucifera]
MRKLWPNFVGEDALETVLEVPIPEEVFVSNTRNSSRSWKNVKSWMRSHLERSKPSIATATLFGGRSTELKLLLGVVGAPLVPVHVRSDQSVKGNIKDHHIEPYSMAKYIVQQYIAATGGEKVLSSIDSMYAMGKVKMLATGNTNHIINNGNNKKMAMANKKNGGYGEVGAFVLWQKRPELWCLELVVSGCKVSAGSDGKVAWRQTPSPWQHSHASPGPPRPLRRSLQGLDPTTTANLFSNSVCIGEKTIDDEDCFVLKLEAELSTLRARSSNNVDIIRHTVWGYFSQRTGLLVELEDSHLLRIKTPSDGTVYWETTMQSFIKDYRPVDGINVAHAGRTAVSLFRFGETSEAHSRTRIEEIWTIEEVDFNVRGLSRDCFLPPSDLRKEQDGCEVVETANVNIQHKARPASVKVDSSKIVAVDVDVSNSTDEDEEF